MLFGAWLHNSIRLAAALGVAILAMQAPAVTRERMYLETMERIFSDTNKIIIDTSHSAPGVSTSDVTP